MKLSLCREKSWIGFVVVAMGFVLPMNSAAEVPSPAAILQDLKTFNVMGTVLHVAAHPDDENTQLITYLARGRLYRTAYLSITRGDGGQNLIGSDLFELLGLARTHELLEAREIDGGRQFFTRAIDFGYSKSWQETLNVWDRQQAVGDVVRVIRTFRPDVIITRFSPQSGGHGQHTASAVLALDAFKVSGDPNSYPEQIAEGLIPWRPKRIMLNAGGFGRGGGRGENATAIQMGVGGTDPVSGETFGELSSRSRAMHKTQGFDRAGTGGRGGGARGGANPMQSFTLMDGEPATNDIMDGVDTTWGRVPDGAEIGRLTEATIAQFKPEDPAASIPALLAIKQRAASLASDPIVNEKRELLDRIIQDCLGLSVQTTVWPIEVVPGEAITLHHTATIRSAIPVRWVSVGFPVTNGTFDPAVSLSSNAPTTRTTTQTIPTGTELTQPYWLRRDPTPGMFVVDEPSLIGQPENPPVFPITHMFEVGGQRLIIRDQPIANSPAGSPRRHAGRQLDIIAPVSLKFASDVRLFAPGATQQVHVDVTPERSAIAGTLQISAPAGWRIEPASQSFAFSSSEPHRFTFDVTAPNQLGSTLLTAEAKIGEKIYNARRIQLDYAHIPLQILQPPARTKAVAIDLKIKGKNVAYLPGAGDGVAECLEQMGLSVTQLTGSDLSLDRLKNFDALVVGIRAFETRQDLSPAVPAIMSFVEGGGNVIFQYNRSGVPQQLGTLQLQQGQQRITDETATPTFLAPDHPALNTPNKITPADFEGWVQERGIYFPSQWDERFTPILAFSDPGEQPATGGLLVAKYGQGHVIWTGLVFFRQLPEGVPGAYRLFANLVSLGK